MTKAPDGQNRPVKPHPIQLLNLGVRELSIRARVPPSPEIDLEGRDCAIFIGHGDYNEKDKTITVSIKLEMGKDKDDPISMTIELRGLFHVNEQEFPTKAILPWAEGNAPIILLPFLREHAYALTSRCGFRPLLLTMVEVPTIKIEKPKARKKKSLK